MAAFETNTGANGKRKHRNKWHWNREEDALLTTLVQRYGPGNWDHIANHIPGRTGKSCRLRWINQLNPKIDKSPFTDEEQQRLLQLHKKYGNRWSTIVNFFPGRTDNQLKNQYHVLVGSRYTKPSSVPSSGSDPHSPLKTRPIGVSNYGGLSTVAVGSQFSNVLSPGNYYSGFAPFFTAVAGGEQMTPSFHGGSSTTCGGGETPAASSSYPSWLCPRAFDNANLENIFPLHTTSTGDVTMSSTNSAAFSNVCPLAQPQRGVEIKNYKFINFMDVQTSE